MTTDKVFLLVPRCILTGSSYKLGREFGQGYINISYISNLPPRVKLIVGVLHDPSAILAM